ncbi:sigma-54 dependent transcriptional regulator [Tropicimonas sp. IMCC34011]|uniref:sigma-54-dependent transcriptional regulator n=1 Tax=Tropicimonas sp. IMCC34011 TaxID=2248759 RepID=UPI000E25B1D3|nr:sigma-54 dependent transcriptional regulator [Tropicimonas sp. IMCC34011]
MVEILILERSGPDRQHLDAMLAEDGYEVTAVRDVSGALAAARARRPGLAIVELPFAEEDGEEKWRELLEMHEGLPVIAITTPSRVALAISALRQGAYEFMVRPVQPPRLAGIVADALRTGGADASRDVFSEARSTMVGASPEMQLLQRRLSAAARSMAPIFLIGESGTGKELSAKAIHALSRRADAPFVTVSCASIRPNMLGPEIFGYLKDSFAGALSDTTGAAERADGGTLFLDEVCELDLQMQGKLLRFLETMQIRPIGSSDAREVDVRIVSSTNRDPVQEMREGRLRNDLFYRLHVLPIFLPPLRERADDVIEIAHNVVAEIAAEEGRTIFGFTQDAEAALREHSWPGNVRELKNVLRNAVVLGSGNEIDVNALGSFADSPSPPPEEGSDPDPGLNGHEPTDDSSRDEGPVQHDGVAGNGGHPIDGRAPLVADGHPKTLLQDTGIDVFGLLERDRSDAPADPIAEMESDALVHALELLAGRSWAEVEELIIEATIRRNSGSIPRAARELGLAPSTIYRKRTAWNGEA